MLFILTLCQSVRLPYKDESGFALVSVVFHAKIALMMRNSLRYALEEPKVHCTLLTIRGPPYKPKTCVHRKQLSHQVSFRFHSLHHNSLIEEAKKNKKLKEMYK